MKAKKNHHHFEIKQGLESGAIRSEKQNFPEEGKGKRQEGEVVSMVGERAKALPARGEKTTHAASAKWKYKYIIFEVRMLDYLNNICLIRFFMPASLTYWIYPCSPAPQIVSMLCTMQHLGRTTHPTRPGGHQF